MTPPKMILAVLTGGVLLGAAAGQFANPVMKFAPEPDWRSRYASHFSTNPMQIFDSGPQDLSPAVWYGPGYLGPLYREPVFAEPPPPLPEYDPSDLDLDLDMARSDAEPAHPTASREIEDASLAATDTAAALSVATSSEAGTPAEPTRPAAEPIASNATATPAGLFR